MKPWHRVILFNDLWDSEEQYEKMWDKYQGLDPALWYSSWAWLSVIENHLLTVYALEMWEAKQEKLLWLCILAQKVMAFYSGIAASAFTLFCYVRNLVLGFNLQHRAMPPQQNVRKGSVKKTIPTIQINSAHTTHYLSKPLALYWFSSQPFSEMIIRFFLSQCSFVAPLSFTDIHVFRKIVLKLLIKIIQSHNRFFHKPAYSICFQPYWLKELKNIRLFLHDQHSIISAVVEEI